ncbi:hypothetical protein MMC29_005279 [Sticta canariensis]|nr:hypothetical protein [Sticta canariensis]
MVTRAATNPEGVTGEFKGDIEVSNKLPSKGDLERIADLPVLDDAGEAHAFKTLYSSTAEARRVLIIFIRHFFCGNCQEYLRALSSVFTPETLLELESPTQIVVIGHGQPDVIPFYVKETACPFPIYADPTKKIHTLLGMTRTLNLGNKAPEYMQDSVMVNAVKSIFQELRSGRNILKGGDLYQVGGEFLFENGKVTWCHRMKNTRDHTEIPELRAVLGLDGGRPPMPKRWGTGLGRALSNRRQSWSRSRSGTRRKSPPRGVMSKVPEETRRDEANGAIHESTNGIAAAQASA